MPAKILVVDDEADLKLLVEQKFRRQIRDGSYDFIFARSGVEALAQLDAHPDVDLILSDINMPEMDGLTLLTKLPASPRQLKAVMVSAYGDMPNIRTAMNRGAFDFVTKPVDFVDLEVTIQKTLHELLKLRDGAKAQSDLLVIRRELELAHRIQQSILPRDFGPKGPGGGCAIAADMQAAHEVGGDFYDFFMIDEDRLGVVLGDVSGKGVQAALYMSLSRTLLRATAQLGLAAGASLQHANRTLCSEGDTGLFVTAVYVIVNTRTGALEYSSAGHFPPLLVRAGGTVEEAPSAGGMVLGIFADRAYDSGSAVLHPGDLMVLYSDGVTEAGNRTDEFYGDERLASTLAGVAGTDERNAVIVLADDVKKFADGYRQSDDITIVAVRRQPA